MTERLRSSVSKPHVLISGALPPPMGGVCTYYQTLLNSSLPSQVDMQFVQTSSHKRELSGTGKVSLSNLILAIQDCMRFTKAVINFRPKLTHISTAIGLSFVKHAYCVAIARLFGSRVLLHPHCSLAVLYYQRPKWWQWYFRWVIRLTDGVIALSKEWAKLDSIVSSCRVYFLPNAIDLKPYSRISENRIKKVIVNGDFQILYMGYLGKVKGTFDILDIAYKIQKSGIKAVFNLVGEEIAPGELSKLQSQITFLNLDNVVKINPAAYGPEKLQFMQNANLFVYPSYYEGMPMAVIEAMACGLPIVASKVGGLPDMIHDGVNGFLIDPGRPDQFATVIGKIVEDDKLCASLGRASFRIASEQFGIEKHVSNLIRIYQKLLITNRDSSIQPADD